jgi:hypothetical protein
MNIPPKRQYLSTRPNGVMSQMAVLLILNVVPYLIYFIYTASRDWLYSRLEEISRKYTSLLVRVVA